MAAILSGPQCVEVLETTSWHINNQGPTAIWRCRKNSSQWQRIFQWQLHSYWLKFLRQCHVAVLRQGPGPWWLKSLIILMCFKVCTGLDSMDQFHKSHNAPVPYPTMHHSEQKCAHFCSEWCIVGYGTGALCDLWIRSIKSMLIHFDPKIMSNSSLHGTSFCPPPTELGEYRNGLVCSSVCLFMCHTFCGFLAFPDKQLLGLIPNFVDTFILELPKPD